MNLEESFQMAVKDESHRQTFLDKVRGEFGLPEYIRKVEYVPKQRVSRREGVETLMLMNPSPLARYFHMKQRKGSVFVFPSAFEEEISGYKNSDDFLSTLVDHEYFHAKESFENPSLIHLSPLSWYVKRQKTLKEYMADISLSLPNFFFMKIFSFFDVKKVFEKRTERLKSFVNDTHAFVDAYELRAYRNELENFKNRNCSTEHMIDVALKIRRFSKDMSPIIIYKFDKEGNIMSQEKIDI